MTTVVGYSFLNGLSQSNRAFFIVTLQPFDERLDPERSDDAILRKVRAQPATIAEANVVDFNLPPELAAAGLYHTMQAMNAANAGPQAAAVRKELLERYGQTFHAALAKNEPGGAKTR